MVDHGVVVTPHDVAVPVEFHKHAAVAAELVGLIAVVAAQQQVAVVPQETVVGLGGRGGRPLVHHGAVHVDEVRLVAALGRVECDAVEGAFLVPMGDAVIAVDRKAHLKTPFVTAVVQGVLLGMPRSAKSVNWIWNGC